jgi:hypothetical protein
MKERKEKKTSIHANSRKNSLEDFSQRTNVQENNKNAAEMNLRSTL